MPVERHGICLGNVLRGRKKEVEKLTFLKHKEECGGRSNRRWEIPHDEWEH
jgi:hypothetical protein